MEDHGSPQQALLALDAREDHHNEYRHYKCQDADDQVDPTRPGEHAEGRPGIVDMGHPEISEVLRQAVRQPRASHRDIAVNQDFGPGVQGDDRAGTDQEQQVIRQQVLPLGSGFRLGFDRQVGFFH